MFIGWLSVTVSVDPSQIVMVCDPDSGGPITSTSPGPSSEFWALTKLPERAESDRRTPDGEASEISELPGTATDASSPSTNSSYGETGI